MKTGLTWLLIGALDAPAQIRVADLQTDLARAVANKNYEVPARSELTRAKKLFVETLEGNREAAVLKKDWAELGLEFHTIIIGEETLWLLRESEKKETGRGWYLFPTTPRSTVCLQAPHARNDVHTGALGLRLFLVGDFRVLAAATITRHRADMAHLDNTFFQAFTLAFAQACPTGLVVQLHGFETENHRVVDGAMIASAGTRTPPPWFGECVERLKKAGAWPLLAYPADTVRLGATLNKQGRALGKTDCRFLHLEMSMELRERLLRDEELQSVMARCLSPPETR